MTMSSSKKGSKQFPNILRFITERSLNGQLFYLKIFLFSFITTFLLVAIILKTYQLFKGVQELQAATVSRELLREEQQYWKNVIARHPDYRDALYKLVVISYQLGEREVARKYLNEVFKIDPNFEQGKEFAGQVGL